MATRTTTILLLRHPEKDPATGHLKESGKETLYGFLTTLWRIGHFDALRLYVSNLPRGQQSISVLERFAATVGIHAPVVTDGRLYGLGEKMKAEVMTPWLNETIGTTGKLVTDGRPAIEPSSTDFEVRGNTYLVRHHYNKPHPGFPHTRREHGAPIGELISDIAREEPVDHKTLVVVIGHSGVVEDWLKTVYLENHPEIGDPTKVGVEELGGLLGFCEGPTITVTYDRDGRASATLDRGHLRGLKVSLD